MSFDVSSAGAAIASGGAMVSKAAKTKCDSCTGKSPCQTDQIVVSPLCRRPAKSEGFADSSRNKSDLTCGVFLAAHDSAPLGTRNVLRLLREKFAPELSERCFVHFRLEPDEQLPARKLQHRPLDH